MKLKKIRIHHSSFLWKGYETMMGLQLPFIGFLNITLGQFRVLQISAAPNLSVKPYEVIPVQNWLILAILIVFLKK